MSPSSVEPPSIFIIITLGASQLRHLGPNLIAILNAAVAALLIVLSIYICYAYAGQLAAAVGPSGMIVVLRPSAFLLVCMAAQILWSGVKVPVKTLRV